MPRFPVALIVLALSSVPLSALEWSSIGPGAGSDLHFMAVQPDDADVIYVSGDIEGIFKTTDGGASWRNINGSLAHGDYGGDVYFTNDIVIDPSNTDRVYLATAVGLFVTEQGGDSWRLLYPEAIAGEDDPVAVGTVAVDPADPQRLFMGLGNASDGTYADFSPFGDHDGPAGLYRSLDGGGSWQELAVGLPAGASVHTVVVSTPLDPQRVLLSSTEGVWRSDDGGDSWQARNQGLPHSSTHRLRGLALDDTLHLYLTVKVIGDPTDSTTFSGGIFTSVDGGDSWRDITGNLPRHDGFSELFYDYWKLDVHPQDPDIIYTGTVRGSGFQEPGVYATWDGGQTWEFLYEPALGGWMDRGWFSDPYVFGIEIADAMPSRIVICADRVDVTDDEGDTWEQKYTTEVDGAWQTRGMELMNLDGIALHPEDPEVFYLGYDDFGLFRSDDGGTSFVRLDATQDPTIGTLEGADGVKDIRIDPDNGDLYMSRWAGSQNGYNNDYQIGGVVFSGDRGETVELRSAGLPAGRADLVLHPTAGTPGQRTLYAAVFHHGVYESTDSGLSWTAAGEGLGAAAAQAWALAQDPRDPDALWLGVNHRGGGEPGLYRSVDGGGSWTGVEAFPGGDVLAVFVDARGTVYASVTDDFDWDYDGGLYRSQDDGATWTRIHEHSRIVDVDVDADDPERILVAGQTWYKAGPPGADLDLSTDGGQTWADVSQGLAHTFYNFARFDSRSEQTRLFVGTAGGGLWTAPLAAATGGPATADFDGSGRVDVSDFFLFADAFGSGRAAFDLNGDGAVDVSDFFLFADAFGSAP